MHSIHGCSETAKKSAPVSDAPAERIVINPDVIKAGDDALDAMEALLARPGSAPSDEPPTSARRRMLEGDSGNGGNGGDDGDGGDDDEPPTSRSPSGPLSRLAVRLDDGAFLVSLEDAADRDLEGREVISFMVLSADEIESARGTVGDALFDAAANVIGGLPKRES